MSEESPFFEKVDAELQKADEPAPVLKPIPEDLKARFPDLSAEEWRGVEQASNRYQIINQMVGTLTPKQLEKDFEKLEKVFASFVSGIEKLSRRDSISNLACGMLGQASGVEILVQGNFPE